MGGTQKPVITSGVILNGLLRKIINQVFFSLVRILCAMNESYFSSNFSCSLLTRVYVDLAIGSAKKKLLISFLGLGIVVGETWLDIKLDACGANSVCLTLSRYYAVLSLAFRCFHYCY